MLPEKAVLVSVHDVMPDTLPEVLKILEFLETWDVRPVTLLVVPGLNWTEDDLRTLRTLQQAGYELAGHGWRHRCAAIETLPHRLHSLIMSRNEAEHLSLSTEQVQVLLSQSYRWFHKVGLKPPSLYVPPAWGMGAISRAQLSRFPFQMYEFLGGVYETQAQRFVWMPVLGYLADTADRVWMLRATNVFNLGLSNVLKRPVRIAIHPFDFQLGLASELTATLQRPTNFFCYADIFQHLSGGVEETPERRESSPSRD